MKEAKIILAAIVLLGTSAYAQEEGKITKKSIRELPADLKTETILFLKFDSVELPAERPKGRAKVDYIKWKNHNEMVPRYNKELRESAKSYPYKYKIISMTDTANYKSHGAKYLFWMNSFDAFTEKVTYRSGHWHGAGSNRTFTAADNGTALGIIDLTSGRTYLVNWTLGVSRTTMYYAMMGMLTNKIKRQAK